jgi:hypothetical protein
MEEITELRLRVEKLEEQVRRLAPKGLRECPVCHRWVAVNLDGRLRRHFPSLIPPPQLRKQCVNEA